jgi:uncharacterized membrane protein YdbT with pleckstrin-like domain
MNTEESLVWKGSPSQWTNFGVYLLCILLTAGVITAYFFTAIGPIVLYALALPLILAFAFWVGTRTHVYQITTERVLETTGLLSRHTSELELYRVRDYDVDEPFWLRLVGCGNIIISSADRSTPELLLRAVPHATTLKDKIRTHTEIMRQRRGVRDIEINPQ